MPTTQSSDSTPEEKPAAIDMSQFAGTVVDRKLRIEQMIGCAERYTLYAGTHLLLNKAVAILLFPSNDAAFVSQLQNDHATKNGAGKKMLGSGTSEGVGYLVYELENMKAADLIRAYSLSSAAPGYGGWLKKRKALTARKLTKTQCTIFGAFVVLMLIVLSGTVCFYSTDLPFVLERRIESANDGDRIELQKKLAASYLKSRDFERAGREYYKLALELAQNPTIEDGQFEILSIYSEHPIERAQGNVPIISKLNSIALKSVVDRNFEKAKLAYESAIKICEVVQPFDQTSPTGWIGAGINAICVLNNSKMGEHLAERLFAACPQQLKVGDQYINVFGSVAHGYLAEKKLADAERIFLKIQKESNGPLRSDICSGWAVLDFKLGLKSESRRHAEQAVRQMYLENDENHDRLLSMYGAALELRTELPYKDLSQKAYARIIELADRDPVIAAEKIYGNRQWANRLRLNLNRSLATLYESDSKYDQAQRVLEKAMAFEDPSDPVAMREFIDVLIRRCTVTRAQQDMPGAIKWARQSVAYQEKHGLSADTNSFGPYRLLGNCLAKQGDIAGARENWERAIMLLRKYPRADSETIIAAMQSRIDR